MIILKWWEVVGFSKLQIDVASLSLKYCLELHIKRLDEMDKLADFCDDCYVFVYCSHFKPPQKDQFKQTCCGVSCCFNIHVNFLSALVVYSCVYKYKTYNV